MSNDSFTVLVKRYAEGETSRWEPLLRDDEGELATFATAEAAGLVALHPPASVSLSVGDMLVVIPLECVANVEEYATWLLVVTPLRVELAPTPPRELGGAWLARWGYDANRMFGSSERVDRRRLVMAASDCAETVLHLVPAGEDRPRIAIEAARAWCLEVTNLGPVRVASDAAWEACEGDNQSIRDTTSGAAWSVAAACWDANARVDLAKTAAWCADEAVARANGASAGMAHATLASLVERWIPLPVALLSALGYPDAIPFAVDHCATTCHTATPP